ncbi:MAG TPA: hypothetical protein VGX23_09935 [Actinocrinis sp.]|nr:hypothetical protein [Actinocrinis sp.]
MAVRFTLFGGAAVALVLAVGSAQGASAASGPAGGGPAVITTTPSAQVGGLPISSLDGQVEYIPGSAGSSGPRARASAGTAATVSGSTGYDISWPQCGGALPPDSSIAVVGVDDGHPFSQNPCLQQEAAWSPDASTRAQYMVLDSPVGWSSPHVLEYAYHGPAGDCTATDYSCQSINWGYNAAYADVQYATSQGATSTTWWLDVELPSTTSINQPGADCYTANFWVCDPKLNALTVAAAVVALKEQGKSVGVYSTRTQWQTITGGLPLGLPIWIAGFDYAPGTYCTPANAGTYWFALGRPSLVQSLPTTYDPDTAC